MKRTVKILGRINKTLESTEFATTMSGRTCRRELDRPPVITYLKPGQLRESPNELPEGLAANASVVDHLDVARTVAETVDMLVDVLAQRRNENALFFAQDSQRGNAPGDSALVIAQVENAMWQAAIVVVEVVEVETVVLMVLDEDIYG